MVGRGLPGASLVVVEVSTPYLTTREGGFLPLLLAMLLASPGVGMKAFVPLLFSGGDGGVGPGDEGLRRIACCSSSTSTRMADVLGRPFTRLRCLAVSPPLRSLPQAGGLVRCLGRAACLDTVFLPQLWRIRKRCDVQEPCVKIQGLHFQI
ncbi:hypothetical protein PVAP13_9KG348683 [Panicum virgatum]|uniref:Uncharacterized protein n=1 Tax=Panicum virgatum TaxID=38727 RepID=A0A8T0NW91_PANVG|nr:hypothetical protein PVAP13_9KG348683 [Panicum virgatum]KAG2550973.1 hypothetical protein PVAP13_9KG348683 [Panicum virgatum]KAG2550974.1 hypothetical protein PVAP13_9KG348683 [Panicum virgatum]